ncbi:DUF928 domain-containing protein [Pantanalinema sp. GBBB05]|uniref:DUF928 domain-containing protein n=1 Tax=Pantanalinema sp. GBBB05 TaxID=2604139 RepID=UPI001D5EC55F|nr:DUF928 domain-containing protein [Pantanalinema sp. GBBB05]
MCLRPLLVLMSAFLLFTETIVTLAQTSAEGTVPIPTHDSAKNRNPITQVLFKPSGTGNPPPTRGAGSRNDRTCSQDNIPQPLALTALVPSNQFGLTWAERPTLWVYLPKTSARQLVLSIREAGNRPHSQSFLPITGDAGVIGIPVATTASPLEVGKSYQWAVVLVCGDRPSPNDPFVTAWVQRVVPSKPFSNQPSALDRAIQYGAQGVWYDAVTTLATMRRSQPNDRALTKLWTDFLTQPSVGLGTIANEPLR